jgi:uncharacterized protein
VRSCVVGLPIVVAIAAALAPASGTAALVEPAGNAAVEVHARQPAVLHLTQTAERKVTPDLLRIELRVEETGADAVAVQAAINRKMTRALDRARHVLGVQAATDSYGVGEEQPEHGSSHWRGSQSLSLTGKAPDAMLKLAGALQADGLLMSSIGYQVSPEILRGTQEDLTAEALAGLAARAASIADRMHLAVLGYRDLRVGNAESGDGLRPMLRMASPAAMPAPVAAPGETTIRLSVEAELLLGPLHP